MNLKQLYCHINTFGKHIEYEKLEDKEIVCLSCDYYLGDNYSIHDLKESRKNLRNSAKMWWETPE